MTRSLAGIFDPSGRADRARLAGALAPHAARLVVRGPLAVSHSGRSARSSLAPLCLLAGCVDNADQLAAELDLAGWRSVEELLAAGYVRSGARLVASLRGDFVLLIWDERRGEGLIARDQLGVRSLYLHDADGVVRFATEVRELLALLPRRPAPDAAGVAHWLAASRRAGEGTLYAGMRRLAPGCMLLLNREEARERRYWRPTFREPIDRGSAELAREVRAGISLAVRRRLPGREPEGAGTERGTGTGTDMGTGTGTATATGTARSAGVGDGRVAGPGAGVLMSGGLDSAAVAAVAAMQQPGRVAAFSGVFPEHPEVDESKLIDGLRYSLALPGVSAEVRAGGLLASALESQQAWEVPLLSWGDFWTLPLLREAASAGCQTILGGDGGDELFATRVYLLADQLRAGRPRRALRLAAALPGAGDGPPRRELLRVACQLGLGGAMPYWLHEASRPFVSARVLPAWLTGDSARELLASEDPFAWKRLDGPRWWAHAAHDLSRGIEQAGVFEMHRHRAALAGLQARHPLLDLDLIETVLRQPPLITFDPHRSRPMLRAAMAGLLPDAVRLRRQKARFDRLIVDTLAAADAPAVGRILSDPRAELGAYVDLAAARSSLLEDPTLRTRNPFSWMQQVWRLVTAECWLRAQADRDHQKLADLLRPSAARVALRRAPAGTSQAPAQTRRPSSRAGDVHVGV